MQIVVRDILEGKGFDGVYWSWEDDLNPKQYQIWNLKKVRRV